MMTTREIKAVLRGGPWAWPGGYPMAFLACDGEALSFDAVRASWRDVCQVARAGDKRDGWALDSVFVNWEDADLICSHTGKPIESAYGEAAA